MIEIINMIWLRFWELKTAIAIKIEKMGIY